MALLGAVWVGLFFFLPLYQQQVLGVGPLEAGLSQLPLAAANMIGSGLAPVLARRLGPIRTLLAGLAVQAAGFLWLARIPSEGTFLVHLLGPVLLVGAGLGVAFVQLTGSAVGGVEPADAGLAGGLVNTTRQIGGAVGLAVLGTLAAARTAAASPDLPHTAALTEGYRGAFLLSAAVLGVGAALTPLLARRARPAPESVPATPPAPAALRPSNRTH
ncbi:MFS transporter [Streptomyces virginiae]|uniref:MFS transporter n=2 Tax=Streptomyces TaxID=1883 RepID=UPI0036CA699A